MENKNIEKLVREMKWVEVMNEGFKVVPQDWFLKNNSRLNGSVKEIIKETEKAVYVTIGEMRGYECEDTQKWLPKSVLMVMVDEGDYVYEVTPKATIKFDKNGKKVA